MPARHHSEGRFYARIPQLMGHTIMPDRRMGTTAISDFGRTGQINLWDPVA
jgi:hypothetical protein